MDHPDFLMFYELVSGALERGIRAGIDEHLGGCAPCKAVFDQATALWETIQSERMAPPREAARRRGTALRRASAPGRSHPAAELIGVRLVFDSLGEPHEPAGPAAGTPGGGKRTVATAARARRLLYSGGGYDLDLRIESAGPPRGRMRFSLRGQILGLEAPDRGVGWAEAALERLGTRNGARAGARTGAQAARTGVDEEGLFTLGPLAAGRYRLILSGEGFFVVVDRLDLK